MRVYQKVPMIKCEDGRQSQSQGDIGGDEKYNHQ